MAEGASPTQIRRALGAGPVVGTFVKLPSVEVIDLVAAAGYAFVVIDLEHSQLDERQARALARHAFAIGLPCMARIPAVDRGLINRLLEAGACGVQLSSTITRRQIDELSVATRYPPDGDRSISLTHVRAGYGSYSAAEFVADQNADPPLLVAQVETAETLDDLKVILQEPVDAAFIGTADLTVSMQRPGDLGDPAVLRRMEEIAAATTRAGAYLGGYAADAAGVEMLLGLGARYILVGSDIATMRSALLAQARAALSAISSAPHVSRGACD